VCRGRTIIDVRCKTAPIVRTWSSHRTAAMIQAPFTSAIYHRLRMGSMFRGQRRSLQLNNSATLSVRGISKIKACNVAVKLLDELWSETTR